MAQGKSQTAPGKAVYLLHEALRVRDPETGEKHYYQPGEEHSADDLHGLVLPALEKGGLIEQVKKPQVPCEYCQDHGTKKQKDSRYSSSAELAEHYAADHPGVSPTEEV